MRVWNPLPALVLLLPSLTLAQTATFRALPDIAAGCTPTSIVTGDFDGDHKPDVAILCTGQIAVGLGNGDGTFQPLVRTSFPNPAVHQYHSLITADFNRDGMTDVATAVDAGILVFVSIGGGKFGVPLLIPLSQDYWFYRIGAADLNGDGFIDLYSLGVGNGVLLCLGKGTGIFTEPVVLTTGIDIVKNLLVADMNADGIPDLLIATWGPPGSLTARNPYATYVDLGQAGGTFAAPKLAANVGATNYVLGDFNGDGKVDVAFGFFLENQNIGFDPYLYVLLGNGDGTLEPPVIANGFDGPFVSADFNGDGKADLAQPAGANAVVILISQGDGSFKPIDNPAQISGHPTQVAVADFNGDGKPDIAAITDVSISTLLNTTPFKSLAGILNAASFAHGQPVAPGSLISIFGAGFSSATMQAGALPLPTSLGGVSITFNGTPAPLSFVSQNQINAQVPWNASGTVNVAVTANGTTFSPFQLQTAGMAPGIFSLQSGAGQAIAINADGSLAGLEDSIPGLAVHPANAGDPLIILATGLGAVSPSISNGAASTDTLRNAVTMPSVLIGGEPAQVLFAGLSPQFVGVNQINVVVPQVAAPGVVPLQINSGGITTSDKVTIAVQNP